MVVSGHPCVARESEGQEPQAGNGGAGVFIVMLPLPPKGVALSVGAAAALVRTSHVGALRLTEVCVAVDVRPMIRPTPTTPAAMALASNALLLMITPMFASMFCVAALVVGAGTAPPRIGRNFVARLAASAALVYPAVASASGITRLRISGYGSQSAGTGLHLDCDAAHSNMTS